ncbi:MAG TPA: hypothetical protein VNC50_01725, partial [Planctomycetia bacterium]|nr:hypothetical protein [Planctomycetia bacterium]
MLENDRRWWSSSSQSRPSLFTIIARAVAWGSTKNAAPIVVASIAPFQPIAPQASVPATATR